MLIGLEKTICEMQGLPKCPDCQNTACDNSTCKKEKVMSILHNLGLKNPKELRKWNRKWKKLAGWLDQVKDAKTILLVPDAVKELPCGCVRHNIKPLGVDREFCLVETSRRPDRIVWIHKECGKRITMDTTYKITIISKPSPTENLESGSDIGYNDVFIFGAPQSNVYCGYCGQHHGSGRCPHTGT
jgi:hypothetical protein